VVKVWKRDKRVRLWRWWEAIPADCHGDILAAWV